MATRRILAVYWHDAASYDAWADAPTANGFFNGRQPCLTVGLDMGRNKHSLHVAASIGTEEVGGIWKIPLSSITRIKVLGRVELPVE